MANDERRRRMELQEIFKQTSAQPSDYGLIGKMGSDWEGYWQCEYPSHAMYNGTSAEFDECCIAASEYMTFDWANAKANDANATTPAFLCRKHFTLLQLIRRRQTHYEGSPLEAARKVMAKL